MASSCPRMPTLGKVQPARDSLFVPNTASVPVQYHASASRGVNWMRMTKPAPQGLLFSPAELAITPRACTGKTAVSSSLPGMFRIPAVDSTAARDPLPWDCITKTDTHSLHQLSVNQQEDLRAQCTKGISVTSPSWFHGTARFHRPSKQSRLNRDRTLSSGAETARELITLADPPITPSNSGSPTSRPQTSRVHSRRRDTMRRTFWNKADCPHVRSTPRVFALERAHLDSTGKGAKGCHQLGKFPFPNKPPSFFKPKTWVYVSSTQE